MQTETQTSQPNEVLLTLQLGPMTRHHAFMSQ